MNIINELKIKKNIYWDENDQVIKIFGSDKSFDIEDEEIVYQLKREIRKEKLKRIYEKK